MLITSIRSVFPRKGLCFQSRTLFYAKNISEIGRLGNARPFNGAYSGLLNQRFFSVLDEDGEEKEKARVASLTNYEKEMELRDLDKQIAILNKKRGINTGELYTMTGKVKALARDYGAGYMVWYFTVWSSSAFMIYSAITLGNVDVMAMIGKVDGWTGYDISSKVDPTLGTIGVTVVANELLEPVRIPFVIMTTKPVVEFFYPKRY